MTRLYCWLTLCPLLQWIGGFYSPESKLRWFTEAAQVAWFRAHNNRLYRWLDREMA